MITIILLKHRANETVQNQSPKEDEHNNDAKTKKVSQKKGCNWWTNEAHMEPLLIPLILGTCNGKLHKDYVNMKLRRYPTSSMLYLYDFRMSLFDNGDLEEFLLFVRNFNMTITASGVLETGTNIQYLRKLFCCEALHQFELLSIGMESTKTLNEEYIINGLAF